MNLNNFHLTEFFFSRNIKFTSCQKLVALFVLRILEINQLMKRCELEIAGKIGRKSAKFDLEFLRLLSYMLVIVTQILLD